MIEDSEQMSELNSGQGQLANIYTPSTTSSLNDGQAISQDEFQNEADNKIQYKVDKLMEERDNDIEFNKNIEDVKMFSARPGNQYNEIDQDSDEMDYEGVVEKHKSKSNFFCNYLD